ncbi:hypothetical protein MRX96_052372 [Rhipicephalus microplus]
MYASRVGTSICLDFLYTMKKISLRPHGGKTVIKKRRAPKMNTHKETQPSESISGVSQRNVRKQSGNQHLPRLPIHDEKISLRPHEGLCLDKWVGPELAGALSSAAGLTTKDHEDIIFRLGPLQKASDHQHTPVPCGRHVIQGAGAETR